MAENNNGKKAKKLTKKQLNHFVIMLLEKRHEILGNVTDMEKEALRKARSEATGDLSSMPIHMADLGTDNYEQEFALELMDGERKLLREIDEALEKIENGTYGICEGTGKPISIERLEALPWAKYTIEHVRELEKQGKI